MRIHIVGAPGSGKTTLARQLEDQLGSSHIELDALYWQANWIPRSGPALQEAVYHALQRKAWVVDGDFDCIRPLIWRRVEVVAWLDYPLPILLWRLTKRSVRYAVTQENLWGTDNHETWRSLLGCNSILIRGIEKYFRLKPHYQQLMSRPEHTHIEFVHLHSPYATEDWLNHSFYQFAAYC